MQERKPFWKNFPFVGKAKPDGKKRQEVAPQPDVFAQLESEILAGVTDEVHQRWIQRHINTARNRKTPSEQSARVLLAALSRVHAIDSNSPNQPRVIMLPEPWAVDPKKHTVRFFDPKDPNPVGSYVVSRETSKMYQPVTLYDSKGHGTPLGLDMDLTSIFPSYHQRQVTPPSGNQAPYTEFYTVSRVIGRPTRLRSGVEAVPTVNMMGGIGYLDILGGNYTGHWGELDTLDNLRGYTRTILTLAPTT